jgi:hypothetical protein
MLKQVITLALFVAAATCAYDCYPTGARDANNYYVAFEKNIYKYSLPTLAVSKHATEATNLCAPATYAGDLLTFATSQSNGAAVSLKSSDLSVASTSNSPAPYGDTPYYVAYQRPDVEVNGDKYAFASSGAANYITRTHNGVIVGNSIQLSDYNGTNAAYFRVDPYISGRLSLATNKCQYRGCTAQHYYRLNADPLSQVGKSVELPNTGSAGCPVQPDGCAVPVLLDFHLVNDYATWVWSIKTETAFEVHVECYDARNDKFYSALFGAASTEVPSTVAPSTAAPSTAAPSTSAPSTAAPSSGSSTAAPSSSSAPVTTKAPSSPTTTKASATTGAPLAGNNNARESSAVTQASLIGIVAAVAIAATL